MRLFPCCSARAYALAALFAVATGCSAAPRAETPADVRDRSAMDIPTVEGESQQSLPRYFTLKVSSETESAGKVWVDGEPLGGNELRRRLRQEAESGSVQGAALIVGPGVSHEDVVRLFGQLRGAGFSHVLVSGGKMRAQAQNAAVSDPPSGVESATPPPEDVEPEGAVAPAEPPVPEDVIVKNLGLHVGGGSNSAANKQRYSSPIALRFDDFRRCHQFANERGRNASFGVDLLIGTKGGRAKIKDYRTSLKGKDFHLCVLGVFGEIEFPAPSRPTVISYSLLFKRP